jgi:hypothetical protein
LTGGDFGEGPAAADLSAFHLPDPMRPGTFLVVPLAEVAEMVMERSDNTSRIKSAIRTGISGLLSAGPAGVSAALLAAGKAPQTVFTVRLRDGHSFAALADAGVFADLHAAQIEAQGSGRPHPADATIAKYFAEHVMPPAGDAPPRHEPAAGSTPAPSARRPARTFGRRGV